MDFYDCLEVAPTATHLEIQRSYRKLARKYHPDVSSAPDATTRFYDIGEAYQTLYNPELRARYDADSNQPLGVFTVSADPQAGITYQFIRLSAAWREFSHDGMVPDLDDDPFGDFIRRSGSVYRKLIGRNISS